MEKRHYPAMHVYRDMCLHSLLPSDASRELLFLVLTCWQPVSWRAKRWPRSARPCAVSVNMARSKVSAGSPPPEDDAYVSSEDEDFDPAAAEDENVSSSSDSEDGEAASVAAPAARRKAKGKAQRAKQDREAEDIGFENSGDEATLRQGRSSKRKREGLDEGDGGGHGGFVVTRSMRAVA
jgi:hypothetical protein